MCLGFSPEQLREAFRLPKLKEKCTTVLNCRTITRTIGIDSPGWKHFTDGSSSTKLTAQTQLVGESLSSRLTVLSGSFVGLSCVWEPHSAVTTPRETQELSDGSVFFIPRDEKVRVFLDSLHISCHLWWKKHCPSPQKMSPALERSVSFMCRFIPLRAMLAMLAMSALILPPLSASRTLSLKVTSPRFGLTDFFFLQHGFEVPHCLTQTTDLFAQFSSAIAARVILCQLLCLFLILELSTCWDFRRPTPSFGSRHSCRTHSSRMTTFRCGGKKRETPKPERGRRFPSAWKCRTQCPAAARHTSRHSVCGPKDARNCEPWSSSDEENDYQPTRSSSQRFSAPWAPSSSQPPPHPDVRVPSTCLLDKGFSPRMPTARCLGFAVSASFDYAPTTQV